MKRLLGGTGVAIGLKILTGIAAAAAAITVAGAATEIATSGSINPQDWGISQQVHTCQDTVRASGTRGIGQCVSAIARHHGHGAASHASGARENGKDNGKDNGKGNANGHSNNGQGNGNGKDKDHGKGSGASGGPGRNPNLKHSVPPQQP